LRILLTNDDGIHAPGLRALRDALSTLGEVQVVAPAAEQSGVALSITYLHPLTAREELKDGSHFGWAVAGSPADCVKLGVLKFCKGRPDLIVSGINSGANVGINVLYSGTVAGAIEGAFFGIPSFAVSHAMDNPPDYPRAARIACGLIPKLMEQPHIPGTLWNINVPRNQPGWPLGVRLASMGVKRYAELIEERVDPRGRPYFWSGIDAREDRNMDSGTDLRELGDGYVTVTPLRFDLTHHDRLGVLRGSGLTLELPQ
jgi:5'-nucleotidase